MEFGDHISEVEPRDDRKQMGGHDTAKEGSIETNEEKKREVDEDVDGLEVLKSELKESIEKHNDRIQTLETCVFQLANYYFVFQGVFFTAVFSGPSHIKCRFRYLPFSLSLMAAFLNLVALVVIALRHQTLLSDLDAREKELNDMAKIKKQEKEAGWERGLRLGLFILTISSLALFAGFNLHGTWKILCYENQQCICSSKECVKICNSEDHN